MIVERTIMIAAPLTLVWRVTADVEHWPDWMPTVQGIRALSPGGLAVGNRFALKQPMQKCAVWQVVRYEPRRVFEWERRREDQLVFLGTHEVEPVGESTRARVSLRAVGFPTSLLRPIFELAVGAECRAMKRQCERLHKGSDESNWSE